MTTSRTGGDALALVERVESVRGEVAGASGDRQFRIYARLTPDALATLARSQQFKRGPDNTVFHRGYPTNYRGQGGVPSVSNSDVRAGRDDDRHVTRWTGCQNWWRGFFGIRHDRVPDDQTKSLLALPATPRIGRKNIEELVHDFLPPG